MQQCVNLVETNALRLVIKSLNVLNFMGVTCAVQGPKTCASRSFPGELNRSWVDSFQLFPYVPSEINIYIYIVIAVPLLLLPHLGLFHWQILVRNSGPLWTPESLHF